MALPPITTATGGFLQNVRFLIHAPPKHGKTFLAATMSEHFVGFPAPIHTVLKDMLWVGWDPNAVEGLVEQNYNVHTIDVSGRTGKEFPGTITDLINTLPNMVKELGIKTLVWDTASFMDENSVEFYKSISPQDSRTAYGNSLAFTHMRVINMLKSLACHVIVITHTKAPGEAQDTTAQQKNKAAAMPGSGGLTPSITGKAKGMYEAMASLILPLHAKKVGDKIQRVVYPTGGFGMEGGSRYQRFLAQEEPADLQLLLKKIRAGVDGLSKPVVAAVS